MADNANGVTTDRVGVRVSWPTLAKCLVCIVVGSFTTLGGWAARGLGNEKRTETTAQQQVDAEPVSVTDVGVRSELRSVREVVANLAAQMAENQKVTIALIEKVARVEGMQSATGGARDGIRSR